MFFGTAHASMRLLFRNRIDGEFLIAHFVIAYVLVHLHRQRYNNLICGIKERISAYKSDLELYACVTEGYDANHEHKRVNEGDQAVFLGVTNEIIYISGREVELSCYIFVTLDDYEATL